MSSPIKKSIHIINDSKIDIPDDILDIIESYKKQLDFSDVLDEMHQKKEICSNCDKSKICLYGCHECSNPICYNCRYNDLNDEYVDKNEFDLFYKCDKCDHNNRFYEIDVFSDHEYYSDLDYYDHDPRYASCWGDCF